MNCDLCEQHILATTQVNWNGGNYHADCIAEAVNRNRAEKEPGPEEMTEIKQVLEDYENEFLDDFADEDIDNLDDVFDEGNIIIPEVLPPDFQPRREVHINDIVATVGNRFVAERAGNGQAENGDAKLMIHCGAKRISREDLAMLDVPEATATFKPIAHSSLVDVIEEALAFRHIRIVEQEFATTPDGMKLFGVLRVNADYEGVGFAIGLRNANDRSMRVGIVSGYRVFCCDNLAFSGDFNPMLQKHSKNLDLIESVSIAIDRIQRQWQPLRMAIDYKRQHYLNEDVARNMIYRLFTDYKLPISLFRTVHKEFFIKPSYEDFTEKTLWSFENAITTAFKKLNPIPRYEQTAKVGRFIADYIQSN
jgi:hypothetical protein